MKDKDCWVVVNLVLAKASTLDSVVSLECNKGHDLNLRLCQDYVIRLIIDC